jgi:hypothetical protein
LGALLRGFAGTISKCGALADSNIFQPNNRPIFGRVPVDARSVIDFTMSLVDRLAILSFSPSMDPVTDGY